MAIAGISLAFAYILANQDLSTEDSDASENETPLVVPSEVVLSNITSSSATISWYTDTPATGYVQFGTSADSKTSVSRDYRDTGASESRKLHYIRITGLRENTQYFIDLFSNGRKVENATITEFKTFETSENLTTPKTALLSASTDFSSGGIFYAHLKNGAEISTTISTFATNNRVALTVSNAKDTTTGEPFDTENSFVLVSATNENGARSREIFAVDSSEDSITLGTAVASNPVYLASQDFTVPTTVVAANPTPAPTPQPTPTPPSTPTNAPATPTQPTPQPSVGGSNTQNDLPKTAIKPDVFLEFLAQFGAFGLVFLGFSLLFKK